MRPVDKWQPGTVALPDGSVLEVRQDYADSHDAKEPLSRNLGCMCSYCEKSYIDDRRDLHVEHIQCKSLPQYKHLETRWDNFLLSCATCNGTDNKGSKDVIYGRCHLPHLNNTFLSLHYDAGGVVTVNSTLQGKSKTNADNLLKLIGLDKGPEKSSKGDKRWRIRAERWNMAERYLSKYNKGVTDIDTIIDLVKACGHWSIWFTVFIDIKEVRQALVERFPGTSRCCFDADYMPIPKNPTDNIDPI